MTFLLVVFGLAFVFLIGTIISAIGFFANGLQILDAIKALPDPAVRRRFLKRSAVIASILTVIFVLIGLPSFFASLPKSNPSPSPDSPPAKISTIAPALTTTPVTSAIASPTSLSVLDCGKPIKGLPSDEGGPPYTQVHIVVPQGCVGILSANKGDVDNGLRHWGQDVGGLIALPSGEHYIIFTDGELGFSPAAIANDKFCQIYTDSQNQGVHLRYIKPLPNWHSC